VALATGYFKTMFANERKLNSKIKTNAERKFYN